MRSLRAIYVIHESAYKFFPAQQVVALYLFGAWQDWVPVIASP
jgi:hypothetical protein